MHTRSVILLTFVLFLAAPTQPQQQVRFPTDGSGLLEFCGPVVASFDSPGTLPQTGDSHGIQMMKQGWCAGHLQTMREMTVYWQTQVVKTVAIMGGEQNPSAEELKQTTLKSPEMTCIPNEVNQAQM